MPLFGRHENDVEARPRHFQISPQDHHSHRPPPPHDAARSQLAGKFVQHARGSNSNQGSSYHYSNSNGSYYYANDNGSTYYQSASGAATYTSPSGHSTTTQK